MSNSEIGVLYNEAPSIVYNPYDNFPPFVAEPSIAPRGADGATWYNGEGLPSDLNGENGDYYLDILSSFVYLKAVGTWSFLATIKGETGNDGEDGTDGTNGTNGTNGDDGDDGDDGATWYSDTGVPSAGLGVDGDFYFDETDADIYKKESSSWTLISTVQGVVGDAWATTSTTSLTIGTGNKTLTVDQNLSYTIGQKAIIAHDFSNYMVGDVSSYNYVNGELIVNVTDTLGSGTETSWDVNLYGFIPAGGGAQDYYDFNTSAGTPASSKGRFFWNDTKLAIEYMDGTNTITLRGPEVSDAEFKVKDNSDATKILQLQCSGITTGTTRTLTIPDKSGTIALTDDILETFADDEFQVVDNSDNTKVLELQCSDITTGTTRTLTAPDKDGVIATIDDLLVAGEAWTSSETIITDRQLVSANDDDLKLINGTASTGINIITVDSEAPDGFTFYVEPKSEYDIKIQAFNDIVFDTQNPETIAGRTTNTFSKNTTYYGYGQAIEMTEAFDSVQVTIGKNGSPNDNITLKVYNTYTGTIGTDAVPTGSPIKTMTKDLDDLLNGYPVTWELGQEYPIGDYIFMLEYDSTDDNAIISTTPYYAGQGNLVRRQSSDDAYSTLTSLAIWVRVYLKNSINGIRTYTINGDYTGVVKFQKDVATKEYIVTYLDSDEHTGIWGDSEYITSAYNVDLNDDYNKLLKLSPSATSSVTVTLDQYPSDKGGFWLYANEADYGLTINTESTITYTERDSGVDDTQAISQLYQNTTFSSYYDGIGIAIDVDHDFSAVGFKYNSAGAGVDADMGNDIIYCELYAVDAGHLPTGSVLATAYRKVEDLQALSNPSWFYFDFKEQISADEYAITLRQVRSKRTNFYEFVKIWKANGVSGGNLLEKGLDGTWTLTSDEMLHLQTVLNLNPPTVNNSTAYTISNSVKNPLHFVYDEGTNDYKIINLDSTNGGTKPVVWREVVELDGDYTLINGDLGKLQSLQSDVTANTTLTTDVTFADGYTFWAENQSTEYNLTVNSPDTIDAGSQLVTDSFKYSYNFNQSWGQAFTADGPFNQISVNIQNSGYTTSYHPDVIFSIYNLTTGTAGTDAVPTGSPIYQKTINTLDFGYLANTYKDFKLPTVLPAGVYAYDITTPNGDNTGQKLLIRMATGTTTSDGNSFSSANDTYTADANFDCTYKVELIGDKFNGEDSFTIPANYDGKVLFYRDNGDYVTLYDKAMTPTDLGNDIVELDITDTFSGAGLAMNILGEYHGKTLLIDVEDNLNVYFNGDSAGLLENILRKDFFCTLIQKGNGKLYILGSSGLTTYNRQTHSNTAGQYAIVSCIRVDENTMIYQGDTE